MHDLQAYFPLLDFNCVESLVFILHIYFNMFLKTHIFFIVINLVIKIFNLH